MDIKDLKEQAKTLEPVLRIGKFGITQNVYNEVEKLLKKRKLVKIKILNNCPLDELDECIRKIIDNSKSALISKIGNTFVIYREKKI